MVGNAPFSTGCLPALCFFCNSVPGFKIPFARWQQGQAAPASPRLSFNIYLCCCRRLPAHSPVLHLCKPFVEVMHVVLNISESRVLSLSHHFFLPLASFRTHVPSSWISPLPFVHQVTSKSEQLNYIFFAEISWVI